MKVQLSGRKISKRVALATAALLAMRLFFVQQLIAAFLLFTVLFVCLAAIVLILFALDYAWRIALGRTEEYVIAVSRMARQIRLPVNRSALADMPVPVVARGIAPAMRRSLTMTATGNSRSL
jgi:hypothetical protein